MSLAETRAALETALNTNAGGVSVAWENVAFEPVTGTPYQAALMAYARPDDRLIGSMSAKQGFLQVELRYPTGAGARDAQARADALQSAFSRGASFTSGTTTVTVSGSAIVAPGYEDQDRYVVVVRIPFTTNFG